METADEAFGYIIKNGRVTITKYFGKEKNLIIPRILGGYEVKNIGSSAFALCTNLLTIEIPNSIINIEGEAFAHCTGLKKLTIPPSVKKIHYMAFFGCKSLISIEIPDSVNSIGNGAFSGCLALATINISNPHPAYRFVEGVLFDKTRKLIHTYLTSNPDTVYVIPSFVAGIGYGAFSGCENLTKIAIPNSVTSIGYGAFAGCKNLITIAIPDSIKTIGRGAFTNCSQLTLIIEDDFAYARNYAHENNIKYAFDF